MCADGDSGSLPGKIRMSLTAVVCVKGSDDCAGFVSSFLWAARRGEVDSLIAEALGFDLVEVV